MSAADFPSSACSPLDELDVFLRESVDDLLCLSADCLFELERHVLEKWFSFWQLLHVFPRAGQDDLSACASRPQLPHFLLIDDDCWPFFHGADCSAGRCVRSRSA